MPRLLASILLVFAFSLLTACNATPGPVGTSTTPCPIPGAGALALNNADHGYCLLYPEGYTVEKPNVNETVLVIGSLMNHTDPRAQISVSSAEGRTAADAAEAVLQDVAAFVPDMPVQRTELTVGGEPAVQLDGLPGQDLTRRVFVVHDGRLYDLWFTPADPSLDVYEDLQSLYDSVIRSITFSAP